MRTMWNLRSGTKNCAPRRRKRRSQLNRGRTAKPIGRRSQLNMGLYEKPALLSGCRRKPLQISSVYPKQQFLFGVRGLVRCDAYAVVQALHGRLEAMYLRKECEELFSQLNFDCRSMVFHFMRGLLKGTEKEKPPADAGTSVGGIQKNTH